MNMKRILFFVSVFYALCVGAWERESVWPKGKMPDAQKHQIAAMTDETSSDKFNADDHRVAYLEWFEKPAKEVANGGCMILISGGDAHSRPIMPHGGISMNVRPKDEKDFARTMDAALQLKP